MVSVRQGSPVIGGAGTTAAAQSLQLPVIGGAGTTAARLLVLPVTAGAGTTAARLLVLPVIGGAGTVAALCFGSPVIGGAGTTAGFVLSTLVITFFVGETLLIVFELARAPAVTIPETKSPDNAKTIILVSLFMGLT
jgi:hypothetical protein